MNERNEYFIAVARRARNSMPGNWVEMIAAIEEVRIIQQGELTAKIQSTPEGIERIRRLFGEDIMIEETIERKLL